MIRSIDRNTLNPLDKHITTLCLSFEERIQIQAQCKTLETEFLETFCPSCELEIKSLPLATSRKEILITNCRFESKFWIWEVSRGMAYKKHGTIIHVRLSPRLTFKMSKQIHFYAWIHDPEFFITRKWIVGTLSELTSVILQIFTIYARIYWGKAGKPHKMNTDAMKCTFLWWYIITAF